jgi:hypothetical protein
MKGTADVIDLTAVRMVQLLLKQPSQLRPDIDDNPSQAFAVVQGHCHLLADHEREWLDQVGDKYRPELAKVIVARVVRLARLCRWRDGWLYDGNGVPILERWRSLGRKPLTIDGEAWEPLQWNGVPWRHWEPLL